MKQASTPGTLRMASAFSTPSMCSIWSTTRISSLALRKYSSAPVVPNDIGAAAAADAAAALRGVAGRGDGVLRLFAAELTIGTTTPQAPASSTRLKFSAVFQGMRTIGAVALAAMAPNIWARVRMSIGLCSVSTTSQSKPSWLTYSAASGEGRESQVPTDGSPAARRRRT